MRAPAAASFQPRFIAALMLGALLQVPGCWCDPAESEKFNSFPGELPGGAAAFCAEWAAAECAYLERCDPAGFAGRQASGTCVVAATLECEMSRAPMLAAEALGRVTYDGVIARGCVAAVAARACGDGAPLACGGVFRGAVTQDAPCDEDLECATGLFCSGGPLTCGLCTPAFGEDGPCWGNSSCQPGFVCLEGRCGRPLAIGSGCSTNPAGCPSGSVCFPPFVPFGVCTALAGEGAPCSQFAPCSTGLVCVANDAGVSRCEGPGEAGATCDPQGRTAPRCDGEGVRQYCDPVDRTCKAITVVAAGAACGTGLVCPAHQSCVAGTCTQRPRDGEACMVSAGVDPCFLSRCDRGLCVAPARAGEPCDAGCPGLTCVENACGKGPCDGGQAWDAWVPPPDASVADAATGALDGGTGAGN